MKKIILLPMVLTLLFGLSSCEREFLESEPTQTIADPPAQAKLNGLYLMMVNTGTGGTTNHDDFGQKGYDIYMDMLSSDMVLGATTYGWYSGVAGLTVTTNFTSNSNYQPWRYYYRLIYAANDVIAGLGGNDATLTEAADKHAMGQAKAIRAYGYFYLMQMFVPKYDPSAKAIPLYTTADVTSQDKATQSEVYGQIVNDLTQSITLLDGFTRANKGMINKYVAEGLLAYTYAAMGENQKAAAASLDIISKSGHPITSRTQTVRMVHTPGTAATGGGFNDLATSSWMWGFDITSENDLDLISWWGQIDLFTYSYAWAGDPKVMDEKLYNSMRPDDIRRNQFASYGGISYWPLNKFYHPDRRIGGQRIITTDYVFMRVDEFHLLAAETLAKSGDLLQAKSVLKNLLKDRLTDTTYIDLMTQAQLLDEIYLQTRIELWGEGKSYLAMKRNKATVTRGANHLYFPGQSFSYDDDRLTFEIPQAEITNNPNF